MGALMADVVLWADDFEAGTALSVDYTPIDCSNNAGVGRSGSRGAQTTGASSPQYYGEILKDDYVTTGVGRKFYAQGYFDHSGIAFAGGGFYAIDIRRGLNVFISLYHDAFGGPNRLQVLWQNAAGFDIIDSADNVYTPGTFTKLRVEWQMSTLEPDLSINPDGYITVFVNDVAIIDEQGIPVMTDDPDLPNWDAIAFGPMGVLDDMEVGYITDEVVEPEPDPVLHNDSTPCCTSGPGHSDPDPNSTPNHGTVPIPLQPWTPQCDGGGLVPSAADVPDVEVWAL